MSGLKIPFTGLQKQYNRLRREVLDTIDLVLRSGQLMNGNYTEEFESWLAKRNKVDHAITIGSGTVALEAIARYHYNQLNLNKPQVIVPNLTYRATANAWISAGWEVVVADTDAYGMLDIDSIKTHHYNTMAVCLVGLYGNSLKNYQTQRFKDLVADHDWILVEDAAQHWLSWDCKRISTSAISFDPTKNLANYANGGAVLTNTVSIDRFVRWYRANGSAHITGGTNSRMSEIDCATMLIKTKYIDEWQKRSQTIGLYWMERLTEKSDLRCLIDSSNVQEHCFHKFVIDCNTDRNKIKECLKQAGIDSKVHYEYGINEIGSFHGVKPLLASSTSLSRRVLSLPIYPELTDLEVEYIIDQVLDCVA